MVRSYRLAWVTPLVASFHPRALPLSLCPYYSTDRGACQGVCENYFRACGFRVSLPSPAGFGRPDSPPFGRIIRTLVRHCYPPCLGGGAQTPRLPTFRAIAPCSGGHRIPLGITPFDGLIVAHPCRLVKGFSGFFCRDPELALAYKRFARRVLCHFMASPCSATNRGARKGWGPRPLLTLTL